MPIASAGPFEPEPEGDVREPGAQPGVVAGVPGLDRVESLVLEALEKGTGAPLLQVGHGHDATHSVHQVRDLPELRQHLVDEGRTAPADIAIEGLTHVDRAAPADHRTGHMGPSHRATTRLPQHVLEI